MLVGAMQREIARGDNGQIRPVGTVYLMMTFLYFLEDKTVMAFMILSLMLCVKELAASCVGYGGVFRSPIGDEGDRFSVNQL